MNRKIIALERDEATNSDTTAIFTLLAWISGPGNTPLARVALRNVRKMLAGNEPTHDRLNPSGAMYLFII